MNSQSKLRAASQCISPLNTALFALTSNQTTFVNFNQCDKPQITDIQPSKLPIGGGTLLVISGVNLGSTQDDIVNVALQCNGPSPGQRISIQCDLLRAKYVPSKKIVCKTQQSNTGPQDHCKATVTLKSRADDEESSSVASMKVQVTGSQLVEFVDPQINAIHPATVIQSANFVWLNIKGNNLDAGRVRQIQIIDSYNSNNNQEESPDGRIIKCEIKNVTSQELKCRLNEKFRTLGKKKCQNRVRQSNVHYALHVAASDHGSAGQVR
jgi:hypothetical protein